MGAKVDVVAVRERTLNLCTCAPIPDRGVGHNVAGTGSVAIPGTLEGKEAGDERSNVELWYNALCSCDQARRASTAVTVAGYVHAAARSGTRDARRLVRNTNVGDPLFHLLFHALEAALPASFFCKTYEHGHGEAERERSFVRRSCERSDR